MIDDAATGDERQHRPREYLKEVELLMEMVRKIGKRRRFELRIDLAQGLAPRLRLPIYALDRNPEERSYR